MSRPADMWMRWVRRVAAPEQTAWIDSMEAELAYLPDVEQAAFARGCLWAVIHQSVCIPSVCARRTRQLCAGVGAGMSLAGLVLASGMESGFVSASIAGLCLFYLWLSYLLKVAPGMLTRVAATAAVAGGLALAMMMTAEAIGAGRADPFGLVLTSEVIAVMAIFLSVAVSTEWVETRGSVSG